MRLTWLRRLPMISSSHAASDIERETIFEMLRNERRRYALHYLKQQTGRVDTGDLAEQVAAWEEDTTIEELSTDARQRVYISMLQTHLPKMDDAGVITFRAEDRTVELTDAAESIDIYLEVVPENDIAWAEYYLGITFFVALLLFVVWQNVYPFSTVPDAIWGLFVAGVLVLATLIHYYHHRRTRLGRAGPPAN